MKNKYFFLLEMMECLTPPLFFFGCIIGYMGNTRIGIIMVGTSFLLGLISLFR